MSRVVKLWKGATYFHVAFFDRNLRIPSVNTYIYDGFDDQHGHLFHSAASHVAQQEGENPDDGHYLSFPDGEIHGILDKSQLIDWLAMEHGPKQVAPEYEYIVE